MASIGAIFGSGVSYAGNGVLAALGNLAVTAVGTAVNAAESAVGPWRPPKWSQPPAVSIIVPGTAPASSVIGDGIGSIANVSPLGPGAIPASQPELDSNIADNTNQTGGLVTFSTGATLTETQGTPSQVLVFDGVLRLEHEQSAQPTEFPVQTGANSSDHIFLKPARLTMQIFMSDVMTSYTPGQFSSSNTRSVSAYQVLKGLMQDRIPLTVNTRLDTYANVVIVNIHTPDDFNTNSSLKATVTFQQIFMAQTSTTNVSSRGASTDETELGNTPTLDVPGIVTEDYQVPELLPSQPYVPYAGDYSSNPVDLGTGFS